MLTILHFSLELLAHSDCDFDLFETGTLLLVRENMSNLSATAYRKLWNTDAVDFISQHFQKSLRGVEQLSVYKKDFTMRTTTRLQGELLEIEIPFVMTGTMFNIKAPLGERSPGVSLFFSQLVVGVTKAIYEIKLKNPEIKVVRIKALEVQNPDLLFMLQKYGFQPLSEKKSNWLQKQFSF